MARQRIALVTGGNRGIGFEVCRQLAQANYEVILTSRDPEKGQAKAKELKQEGLNVKWLPLDITDSQSIANLHHTILQQDSHLDVLINNAAVFLDKTVTEAKGSEAYFQQVSQILQKTLQTNVAGAFELCERFLPLMVKQNYGRIVNVSSGLGQLSEPHSDALTYSISKTALNGVTCFLANTYKGKDVLINSVCPGWVKTDMGGEEAPRSIQEGAAGIVWAATLPSGGPTGGFFRDGMAIQW
jgi:NAD(P)-dependent dehydrogenase (short-subunit alcohol dehydrogenase family)